MKRLFAILCIYTISHSMAYAGSYLGDPLDPGDPYFYNPTQDGGIAHFLGSQTCGSCHDTTVSQCDYLNQTESCVGNGNPLGHFDKDGNDVSIRRAWSATMMGNSLRDPYFLAKIKKELTRNPDHAQEINTSCTRCHAPMANVDAEVAGTSIDVFDTPSGKGILSVGNIRHDLGMDGVSCSVCHQIQDDPSLGTQDANTGGYKIDTSLVGVNRLMYGPYLNADMYPGPMKSNKALNGALQGTPWYSKHITQSQVCGTCHDVKTPIRDRHGNIVSQGKNEEFPEQMNYTEWFNSDYNTGSDPKTCQQCHMARTNGVYVSTQPKDSAAFVKNLTPKDNYAIHEFVGGNRLMLDILNQNKTQLGVLSNNFGATMDATSHMLETAAKLNVANTSTKDGKLKFTLHIDSETGHKLPTGFPSRRVILHVAVSNGNNKIVWESGAVNPDGTVKGLAEQNLSAYEKHYDLITQQNQVQVYEGVICDQKGRVIHNLFDQYKYCKDNRILPKGFDKNSAPGDVKVAGRAMKDPNFIGGSDEITYSIAGLPRGYYSVKAELIYQSVSHSALKELEKGPGADESIIRDFVTMFDESSEKSQVITQTVFGIQRD